MVRESKSQCPFERRIEFNGKRERVSVPIRGGKGVQWEERSCFSAHSRGKKGSMGREIMFQCPSERENRFISVPI
jgi:hypothetical protein